MCVFVLDKFNLKRLVMKGAVDKEAGVRGRRAHRAASRFLSRRPLLRVIQALAENYGPRATQKVSVSDGHQDDHAEITYYLNS